MKKGCLIAAIALLIISAVGLTYYFYSQRNTDTSKFETEKPAYRDIIKKAVATGSIKPRQEVNIKPQVSGVVDQLFVTAGDIVKKGQKIARIKLIPSEVNINSARSNVELARIRLNDAEKALSRQRNISQKRLDVNQAKASYDTALREKERQRKLFEDGVISEQEYKQFELDAEVKRTAYENAEIASTGNLAQFEAEVDIRRQELQAARNNLQLLREGATSNSKQVANVVSSTVDGMVLDVPVEEGSSVIERNNFNEGTTIAAIADMNALIFEGKVDEADVGKIQEGMPLELTVGAIDDHTFDAVLEFISPKGVEEDGTVKFEVRAAMKRPVEDVFLRAGYSANADIILDRRDSVLSIQERDVIFDNDTTYVEVSEGDDAVDKKVVELGLSDGILVEVLSGADTTTLVKVQSDKRSKNKDDS